MSETPQEAITRIVDLELFIYGTQVSFVRMGDEYTEISVAGGAAPLLTTSLVFTNQDIEAAPRAVARQVIWQWRLEYGLAPEGAEA